MRSYMMRAVSHAALTDYSVRQLLRAKKFIYKELANNWDRRASVPRIELIYDIRRVSSPNQDLRLKFSARLSQSAGAVLPRPLPGVALLWHGERVRGIDSKLRHDVIKNDAQIGIVRGWHEHQWTEMDGDRFVINANRTIKQPDFWTLVRICLKRWNIEYSDAQLRLGEWQ